MTASSLPALALPLTPCKIPFFPLPTEHDMSWSTSGLQHAASLEFGRGRTSDRPRLVCCRAKDQSLRAHMGRFFPCAIPRMPWRCRHGRSPLVYHRTVRKRAFLHRDGVLGLKSLTNGHTTGELHNDHYRAERGTTCRRYAGQNGTTRLVHPQRPRKPAWANFMNELPSKCI